MIQAIDRLHLSQLIGQAQSEQGVNADLNHIDITAITDLSHLFFNTVFNGDISCWDTSRVTNMEKMFADSSFNGDISRWDTSQVESMNSMFRDSKFNGDISQWDVRNVQAFGRFISPNANIALPLRFMWHLPSLFHEHTRDIDTYLQGLAPGVMLPAHTQRVLQSHQKLSYVSDEFFQFVKQAQGQMKSLGLSIQAMSHQIHAAWEVR